MKKWIVAFALMGLLIVKASAQGPVVQLEISPENPVPENAQWNTPMVIETVEEAGKHFSEDAVKSLQESVDFRKQFLLVFAWRGSGGDRLNHTVAESFPEQITFSRRPGMTRDLRPHVKVFALRSNVKWNIRDNQ